MLGVNLMISRKTAKTLAEIYHIMFESSYHAQGFYNTAGQRHYKLRKEQLYDFLYEHDYDAWFLNSAQALKGFDKRELATKV